MLTLTENEVKALQEIINYTFDDEATDYDSCGPRDRRIHIFRAIKQLDKALKRAP